MPLFRDLFLVSFFSFITYIIFCLLQIAPTNPILTPPVLQQTTEAADEFYKSFSFLEKPLPSSVFNAKKNIFEYGRYHHKGNDFLNADFSFPPEAFEPRRKAPATTSLFPLLPPTGWAQKLLTLKEWSWIGVTDGQEWLCGGAMSTVQTASGLFMYCYNSKTGRAFHSSQQSVEWHLLGGYGTQQTKTMKNNNDDDNNNNNNNRSPYANNGCLEWDYGKMSNEQIASGSHCFNETTKQYDVKMKMVGIEIIRKTQDKRVAEAEDQEKMNKKNKKTNAIDDLEEGQPVVMELDFSFDVVDQEGMTLVYPLGGLKNNRAGMSTKYSASSATVRKLSVKKTTSFEQGEKGEKERSIVDFVSNDDGEDIKNNNNNKKDKRNFVALLDWTRSMFPRRTVWKWVAFSTILKSKKANIFTPTTTRHQATTIPTQNDETSIRQQQQQQQQQELMKKQQTSDVENVPTRVGLQLTALSYLSPGNFSMESTIWINSTAFAVDTEVLIEEQETTIFKPKKSTMMNNLGRTFKVSFDDTKRSGTVKKNNNENYFKLEMTFVRRGAHVQDFSEFWPLMDGALDHQWGEYSGELTHFVKNHDDRDYSFSLKHIYRFEMVPGILEDHDTVW